MFKKIGHFLSGKSESLSRDLPDPPQVNKIAALLDSVQSNELWICRDYIIKIDASGGHALEMTADYSLDLVELIYELVDSSRLRLDPSIPYGGGVVLGYPWRWHAVIPPLSPDGPRLCLRRQRMNGLRVGDFRWNGVSPYQLLELIRSGKSIVIFGPTGSGKTSFLSAVLLEFFAASRVAIAESVMELPLLSPLWIRLTETHPDVSGRGGVSFERVAAELMRLTPEVIVLGEIRGAEAKYLKSLALTGHGGVLTTIHASSAEAVYERLAQLACCGVESLPEIVPLHARRKGSEFEIVYCPSR